MKKYECVIIVSPNLTENKLTETIEKISNKIKEVAKITEVKRLGKKKLAYPVKSYNEGNYIAYEFGSNKSRNNSTKLIETFIKTQDEIIKYIMVGRD